MPGFVDGALTLLDRALAEWFQCTCLGCKKRCPETICEDCRVWESLPPNPLSSQRSALRYAEPWRTLLHEVKFHRNRACLKFFLPVVESADFSWVPRDAVIVPVPMFWLSFWKRGFNQSEWLAWQIQKVSGLKIELDGLQKYKRTKPQSLSKVGARKGRLKKCMRWGGAVVPRAALLVDDVVTSGGTVAECARALEKAGVEEVFVWTLFSAKPRQLSFSLPRSSL